jgi:hypothetical protein
MRFLLPQGEGQDEGKKEDAFLFDPLTLALSRREKELRTTWSPPSKIVPYSIGGRFVEGQQVALSF